MGRTVRDTARPDAIKARDLHEDLWVIQHPEYEGSLAVKVQHASDVFRRPGESEDRVAVVFEESDGTPFYTEIDADHQYHKATEARIANALAYRRRVTYVAKLRQIADLIERHNLPVADNPMDLTVAQRLSLAQVKRVAEVGGGEITQSYGYRFAVRAGGPAYEFGAEWVADLTLDEIGDVAPDKVGRCDEHGLWLVTPRTPAGSCPTCSGLCTALGCGHPIGEHGVDGCTATIGSGQHTSRCQCRKTDDALKEGRP